VDITEQEQMTQELRRREAYRALVTVTLKKKESRPGMES
jgi:hypothetical protein